MSNISIAQEIFNRANELKEKYNNIGNADYTMQKWVDEFDNYLQFLLDNCDAEMTVVGVKTVVFDYKMCPDNNDLWNMKNFRRCVDMCGPLITANGMSTKSKKFDINYHLYKDYGIEYYPTDKIYKIIRSDGSVAYPAQHTAY